MPHAYTYTCIPYVRSYCPNGIIAPAVQTMISKLVIGTLEAMDEESNIGVTKTDEKHHTVRCINSHTPTYRIYVFVSMCIAHDHPFECIQHTSRIIDVHCTTPFLHVGVK